MENTNYYATIIAGDETDIYYPQSHETDTALPVALFLQGFDIDKSSYSQLAKQLAGYGFLVLIPNHRPSGRPFLAPEMEQVALILTSLERIAKKWEVDGKSKFDFQKIILLGHSCGGLTGLQALQQIPKIPKLVGGVFYGSQLHKEELRGTGRIPIAMVAGSQDGIVSPELTKQTFKNLQSLPKAYIEIRGANHYGITDVAQPPDGPEESKSALLAQEETIERIAKWAGKFMRAYILKEEESREYFLRNKDKLDEYTSLRIVEEE